MTRDEFIKGAEGYGSHRPLLWEALEATKYLRLPVLELGCGYESTPFLQQYCKENDLLLFSYDFNQGWAFKFHAIHTNWEEEQVGKKSYRTRGIVKWDAHYGVVLVDESPGEHRKRSIHNSQYSEIIVVHDSEPPGWNASDYRVRPLFSKFKYVKDDVPKEKGAPWTTALSHTIDVTKWP